MSRKSSRAKGRQAKQSRATIPPAAPSRAEIDRLIERKDFKAAIRLLRSLLARRPADDDRRLLANCLFETDAFGEGRSALETIFAKTATDIALIGWTHFCEEQWESATSWFEQALEIEQHPATYYYLARARAKDQADYLLNEETRDEVRRLLGCAIALPACPERAFLWLEHLQGYAPEHAADRRSLLERALSQHPDSSEVRLRLASLHLYDLQDSAAALGVLEPLLGYDPPPVRALWLAFEAYNTSGDCEGALASVNAIARDSDAKGVGLGKVKGDLLLALGRTDDAVAQYDEEVARPDADAAIVGLFSRAWVRLSHGDAEAAFADVAAALDRHFAEGDLYRFGDFISLHDEIMGYPCDVCVRQVCTALLQSTPDRPPLPADMEGRLSYVLYKLDGDDTEESRNLLLRAAELIAASDPARDALDEDLIGHHVSVGQLPQAVEAHLQRCQRRYVRPAATEPLPADFADFDPSDYDPSFERASIRTKTERTRIHRAALRQLKACQDPNAVQAVFVPFYRSFWRSLLFDGRMFKEVAEVTSLLRKGAAGATGELFDHAYALHESGQLMQAEMAYRQYLEAAPENASVLHNLSIVVDARGNFEEAVALSNRAATAAPKDDLITRRYQALEAHQEQKREQDRRLEEFLETAPDRWPQLDRYKRQLLSTLTVISGFDDWAHLSRLSGIGERYLRGHWQKLIGLGMVVEDGDGHWQVNRHITHLISQERSHAVVTTLIHAESTLAVKPIFNSLQEYTIYKLLITLFPNHLVFPNMALQAIFQYERMQDRLNVEEFRYYLMAHVDVCVTSTANYLPIVAFEIDSSYHDRAEQVERDTKKNHIFQVGGVPLVRLRAWGQPTEEAVRQYLVESVRALGDELSAGTAQMNPLVDVAKELDLQRFAPVLTVGGEDRTTGS